MTSTRVKAFHRSRNETKTCRNIAKYSWFAESFVQGVIFTPFSDKPIITHQRKTTNMEKPYNIRRTFYPLATFSAYDKVALQNQRLQVQSNLDISNSDISYSAKIEASNVIKNIF